MDKQNYIIGLFALVFLCSVTMIFIENSSITGHAVESTSSSVTIQEYYAISMSTNLSNGITFGTANSTSSTNVNASGNYNNTNFTVYYMTVSSDSNAAVDFTIQADGPLNTSTSDEIGLGNESYHYSTSNDISNPDVTSEISLTTSPQAAGSSVAAGSNLYYRFWLDIPAATPVGVYNNTISINGAAA